jgi:UDP-glucose:(heptosyl)LPS alpha-1,3-glucosyltransferase
MANVVLEALASGLPVVTSRESGNAEMIADGADGWIIDQPDDARDVAKAIAAALPHLDDPALARRARSKAEQFTLDRAAGRVLDVFVHLQSRRRSGPVGPLVAA